MHCLALLSGPCTGRETGSVFWAQCWSHDYEVGPVSWSEMMCNLVVVDQIQSSWVVHCQLVTAGTFSEAELDCCEETAAPVAELLHFGELCWL